MHYTLLALFLGVGQIAVPCTCLCTVVQCVHVVYVTCENLFTVLLSTLELLCLEISSAPRLIELFLWEKKDRCSHYELRIC